MANIIEEAVWETGVREVGEGEPVTGGVTGTVNLSLQDLSNRTVWLKKELEAEITNLNAAIEAAKKAAAAGDDLALKKAENLADVPDKAKARQNLGIATQTDNLKAAYPVGSIYITTAKASPATTFGFGTWSEIRGRFLMGVDDSHAVKATGGEATHKLTVGEMPAHAHSATGNANGAHTHTGTCDKAGDHHHGTWGERSNQGKPPFGFYNQKDNHCGSSGGLDSDNTLFNTSTDGAHTHKVTLNQVAAHAHTITVKNTGGGAAHNNLPPYFVVHFWQRTA